MTEPGRGRVWRVLAVGATLLWLAVLLPLLAYPCFFEVDLSHGVVPSVYALLAILWDLLGVVPFLLLVVAGAVSAGRRLRFFALSLLVVGVIVVSVTSVHPIWVVRQFAMRWPRAKTCYDGLVERLRSGVLPYEPSVEQGSECGSFTAFPGPPLRVAFDWRGGDMDKPEAIVYDPSGELASAGARQPFDAQLYAGVAPIVAAHGGRIRSCRRLEEPYYHCVFGYR